MLLAPIKLFRTAWFMAVTFILAACSGFAASYLIEPGQPGSCNALRRQRGICGEAARYQVRLPANRGNAPSGADSELARHPPQPWMWTNKGDRRRKSNLYHPTAQSRLVFSPGGLRIETRLSAWAGFVAWSLV